MKKCWVKVIKHNYLAEEMLKWKKGGVISEDVDTKLFKVRYKDDGVKEANFSKKFITFKKPEELKFKMDEESKRGLPWKISFSVIIMIFIGFWMTSSYVQSLPTFIGALILPSAWLSIFVVANIVSRIIRAEIRQEKILELLEGKNDN